MLRVRLRREGVAVDRRHVSTLMKWMGVRAIGRRPRTNKLAEVRKIVLLSENPITKGLEED
jgi:putative transposase